MATASSASARRGERCPSRGGPPLARSTSGSSGGPGGPVAARCSSQPQRWQNMRPGGLARPQFGQLSVGPVSEGAAGGSRGPAAASSAGGVVSAAVAGESSAFPQPPQNRSSGSLAVPHEGQHPTASSDGEVGSVIADSLPRTLGKPPGPPRSRGHQTIPVPSRASAVCPLPAGDEGPIGRSVPGGQRCTLELPR